MPTACSTQVDEVKRPQQRQDRDGGLDLPPKGQNEKGKGKGKGKGPKLTPKVQYCKQILEKGTCGREGCKCVHLRAVVAIHFI